MWVVKIGGSLGDDDSLKQWLKIAAHRAPGSTVVVPGGGGFADLVREAQLRWQFEDGIAHRMAILAMQQFAWQLIGIEPGLKLGVAVQGVKMWLTKGQNCIWLPDPDELDRHSVPATWQVTSDSLAAWLANRLNATGLLLIKSAVLPEGEIDWHALTEAGIIDEAFNRYRPASARVLCWHRSRFKDFLDLL